MKQLFLKSKNHMLSDLKNRDDIVLENQLQQTIGLEDDQPPVGLMMHHKQSARKRYKSIGQNLAESMQNDPSLRIFYEDLARTNDSVEGKLPNVYETYEGTLPSGRTYASNAVNKGVPPQVLMKAIDPLKAQAEYEFELINDPNRFVAMKTKKKKAALKEKKNRLDFYQIDRAKDIIDRSILDVQHQLNKAEYD